MANTAVDRETLTVHINDEKHILDASQDLSESLNDFLRRKTRFKVDHVSKPSLRLYYHYTFKGLTLV